MPKISKTESARRQLDMAIELFFENRDLICIRSLCGAAWAIIWNLHKSEGTKSVRNWMRESFPDHNEKEIWNALDDDYNFLKHANTESRHESRDIDLEIIPDLLFFICQDFSNLGLGSLNTAVYELWFLKAFSFRFKKQKRARSKWQPGADVIFPNFPLDLVTQKQIGLNAIKSPINQAQFEFNQKSFLANQNMGSIKD